MNTWKLQHIAYKVVKEQHYEVALLPIGSCEPHNHHLPYGSDALHSEGVADRLCAAATELGAKVVQLPTIPYGVQSNMLKLPLAINVYPTTLMAFLKDIVNSLENSDIRKLIILNGHGGNDFLKPFVREMMGRSKVFICIIDWWKVGNDIYKDIFEAPDDHGGEMETSGDMALFGHLVHLEDALDGAWKPTRFEAVNKGWVSVSREWHLLTESTGVGNPSQASAEKGEKYISVVVERLARFVQELSDTEMDEKFPF
ncbi:MAG: creatininase family protein [Abitibacteriaceae bacterium]|nr:creatininase family protein [Abditibacteriaceae bacterium]